MIELLLYFLRLARLQRAPQDLPTSPTLLLLCLLANLVVGVASGAGYFGGAGMALLANGLDVMVVSALVWLLLSVNNHTARLVQTLTALFGLGALFGLVMILLDAVTSGMGGGPAAGLLVLAVLVWAHVAAGHVLRHALEQPLLAGVALAVGISAVSFVVVGNLVPVPAPPAG